MPPRLVWTTALDEKLVQAMKQVEMNDWVSVSQIVGVGRKQCRTRWESHFCSTNHEQFTQAEDA
jgi:hypothetical protein